MRKVFIQHSQTKMFLHDGDRWTPETGDARDFTTSLNALAFCLQKQMPDAQIILRFEQPGMEDVVVPVRISRPVKAVAP
jgi:hypothetical protein